MIKKFRKLALISTITCGLVAQVTPASAQRNITCESYKGRYNYCRVDTRGGVTLTRRISNAECSKGNSWGYDRDGIWVDHNCKAEFTVGRRESNHEDQKIDKTAAIVTGVVAVAAITAALANNSDKSNHHSSTQSITCSSENDDYKHCSVNIHNRDRVMLKRQLSDSGCWEDNTWGTDRNGIWVDRGCRAVFEIKRQG